MIHNHYGTKDERKKSRKRIAAGKRAWATRMQRKQLKELMNAPSVLEKADTPAPARDKKSDLLTLVYGVIDMLELGATSLSISQEGLGQVHGHIEPGTDAYLLTIVKSY